jgi:hypothetical protein
LTGSGSGPRCGSGSTTLARSAKCETSGVEHYRQRSPVHTREHGEVPTDHHSDHTRSPPYAEKPARSGVLVKNSSFRRRGGKRPPSRGRGLVGPSHEMTTLTNIAQGVSTFRRSSVLIRKEKKLSRPRNYPMNWAAVQFSALDAPILFYFPHNIFCHPNLFDSGNRTQPLLQTRERGALGLT